MSDGRPQASSPVEAVESAAVTAVRQALRRVIDPELGINVIDLGLVYGVEVVDGDVRVALTMTTPACPLHEYITTNAEAAIWREVTGVRSVQVDLVWEPKWRPEMMTAAAKQQLGWEG